MPAYFYGDVRDAASVTPSDTVDLPVPCSAIYVGTAGNLGYVKENGVAVIIVVPVNGTVVPIRAKRINAAGTTATNIVALWR